MIDLIMMTLFEKNHRESLHSERVGDISEKIALAMEYSDEQVSQIRLAGLMHDVGKIGITENVLDGKFKLSKEDAIIELNRCKNTQFDPEIVEIFIDQVVGAL